MFFIFIPWLRLHLHYITANILKLRQSTKNDKKKRKEALAQIDKLEKELGEKHRKELEEFAKTQEEVDSFSRRKLKSFNLVLQCLRVLVYSWYREDTGIYSAHTLWIQFNMIKHYFWNFSGRAGDWEARYYDSLWRQWSEST